MTKLKRFNYYRKYAKDFAKNELGKELDIPVEVNNRRRALGGFMFRDTYEDLEQRNGQVKLLLNMKRAESHEEMIGVVKHEVIHWYCYVTHQDFNDGDKDFETMLYQHNAPSTYFGMKGEEHSKYIQRKIMNDEMNVRGMEGTKYKKCDDMECYSLIEENDKTLIDVYNLNYEYIRSTYKVYYDKTQIGYVINAGGGKWVMVDNNGIFTEKAIYNTRKDAVLPHIFEYETHRAG